MVFLLGQWSPTFLAPGTGFVEDSFSTDQWGMGGRQLYSLPPDEAHLSLATH